MAETAYAQINLAQAIEEQQPCLHSRVLEFLVHEFQRRERTHLEQAAACGALFEQRLTLLARKRRRASFGDENIAHDWHEVRVPAPQGLGVAFAESRERRDRALDIGPPFKRAPLACDQGDVELRFDVARAMAFKLEVGVPRHGGDGALEERVGVVQEPGVARVFQGGKPAPGNGFAFDRQGLEAGFAQVGLQD